MGDAVQQPVFHVLLDGREVGPYDRRTIVGMRIKETLTSDHVLRDSRGAQLTVGELIKRTGSSDFNPTRTGGYSVVRATYTGCLVAVHGRGLDVPAFKGEAEIRVQADVLRIAGRFRRGVGWKEDRVKVALKDVVHARVQGSRVDLWLRAEPGGAPQRLTLELFTAEAAGELVDWLPAATPWPSGRLQATGQRGLWVPVAGMALALGIVLTVLLVRRLY